MEVIRPAIIKLISGVFKLWYNKHNYETILTMPISPKKVCAGSGCSNLTSGRYCDFCQKKKYRQHNQSRDRSKTKFYGTKAWKQARRAQLAKEPLCIECKKNGILTNANEVDHIVSREQGGADLDGNNLQSLCKPCHSRKTAYEVFRGGKTTTEG